MSRAINRLTALKVKNLKFDESTSNKYTDGDGLYLQINKNGSKYWRMDYTNPITKKRNTLALGVYPTIALEQARKRRDEVKLQLAEGKDPASERDIKREQAKLSMSNAFKFITQDWLALREKEGKKDSEVIRRLNKDVLPFIGDMPISQLSIEVIENEVTNRIVERGALELARKVLISVKQILEYARRKKLILINPAHDVILPKPISGNFAAITDPSALSELIKAVWDDTDTRMTFVTRCAVKISLFIFSRPTEIRTIKWTDYNREDGVLNIYPLKQKATKQDTDKPKIVIPLPTQAIELLQQLYPLTGHREYIFASNRGEEPYISESTVNEALKRIGFKGEQTAHGFRATARTILEEELDIEPIWIERQLAHKVRDANGESYNRTKHVKNRKAMLQIWADYLTKTLLNEI
ncbi:tyrosine-type recombinase/integrase [Acinetobacter baumannii]|uniref:tyrosine-type recombinase/integrase n=1 Tax=Acinetobacter calcoaceticus/baumannii complex TaxID=909768 RepID=UPI0005808DC8|nr:MULTISPECIES: integrase arm-type DNA-binding domain-containing protein [Acinetobacter calcoaceticus/baumannii complex]EHU2110187.1 integrase arm-type DNA-binding domain-containing protein [Acinetobacter baumannii]EHZ6774879.1 integrase arm-type DNA-binding domain-containing protein [Acinetobacter baumannii]EKU1424601.1 integrase arm-type DNA-binding domain-containing protein [Acinetobacter baumannii]EKU3487552.1 integrase arm-type DNA-binding domain-containing protein [Acinetobacter baumanni